MRNLFGVLLTGLVLTFATHAYFADPTQVPKRQIGQPKISINSVNADNANTIKNTHEHQGKRSYSATTPLYVKTETVREDARPVVRRYSNQSSAINRHKNKSTETSADSTKTGQFFSNITIRQRASTAVLGKGRVTSTKPADQGARVALIRTLQTKLDSAGCYRGSVNGSWDRKTRTAMQRFMQSVNAQLPLNDPDVILLALLNSNQLTNCSPSPCSETQQKTNSSQCSSFKPHTIAGRLKSARSRNISAHNIAPKLVSQTIIIKDQKALDVEAIILAKTTAPHPVELKQIEPQAQTSPKWIRSVKLIVKALKQSAAPEAYANVKKSHRPQIVLTNANHVDEAYPPKPVLLLANKTPNIIVNNLPEHIPTRAQFDQPKTRFQASTKKLAALAKDYLLDEQADQLFLSQQSQTTTPSTKSNMQARRNPVTHERSDQANRIYKIAATGSINPRDLHKKSKPEYTKKQIETARQRAFLLNKKLQAAKQRKVAALRRTRSQTRRRAREARARRERGPTYIYQVLSGGIHPFGY